MVISKNMERLVENSSVIRKLFEEGKALAKVVGEENVYDYSLGNPSTLPPEKVKTVINQILETENPNYVHGYMKNAGFENVRQRVADYLNKRYQSDFDEDDIIMTAGAAGGLNCVLRTLLNYQDEVVCFAPFFGEYQSYIANFGGEVVIIPADTETFQPNVSLLASYLNEKTKAIILNSPNNPSGIIYTEESLKEIQRILAAAEERIGHPIYVLSDEPYRELVYDGHQVPYMPDYIKNCIIIYSFSKTLSLPGERIGYMAIPKQINSFGEMRDALIVANRCLGYINAPSLFQLVVQECLEEKTDVSTYDKNRQLLYEGLTEMGFSCVKPQGAFYLFVKSPVPDEQEFVNQAKTHNLIIVSAKTFGCPGYVRLAYCIPERVIRASLPAFKCLAAEFFAE